MIKRPRIPPRSDRPAGSGGGGGDNSGAWYVLVGGEAYECQGKPQGRDLMHTSLTYVAQAYAQLRGAGVPRERIITICQVHDYLNGLGMRDSDYPKSMYLKECALLLREGGADYDHRAVNPHTIWAVLLGLTGAGTRKVVPAAAASVTFAVYSHGDSHPAAAGKKEKPGTPLDPLHHEWFCHLPYPADAASDLTQRMTQFVALDGARTAGHSRNRPLCYLYATQLRAVFAQMFRTAPRRPVVGLLNYCRSGGGLEFLQRPAARRVLGADTWPLFLMSSCQPGKDALVGGLWTSWFELLAEQLEAVHRQRQLQAAAGGASGGGGGGDSGGGAAHAPAVAHGAPAAKVRREATAAKKPAQTKRVPAPRGRRSRLHPNARRGHGRGGGAAAADVEEEGEVAPRLATLKDLYIRAQTRYYEQNMYQLKDFVKTHAYASNVGQRTESFDWDLSRFICAGPGGLPDYKGIERMQREYRDGTWYGGRSKVKIWHPRRWEGNEVSLVEAVKKARRQIAHPRALWGHAEVADLALETLL